MSETNKRAFTTIIPGHHYKVPVYKVAPNTGIQATGEMCNIIFVRGSKVIHENREPALEGTLHEHLITVMIEDLKLKHAEFPSKETACAITNLEQARQWMEEREKARAAQGVLGTYQPHKS
ncbi:hypothetical protein ACRQ5D_10785 [Mucilaginibacter sp. P25]|uniref:hypothetical protein n=1 Tax=Mucilaginibacter sp. P25 TaxID=3423945 RepID=UPI003D7B6B41